MCKVYEFPQKKELSDELKEMITELAKRYVDVLYKALDYFETDEFDYAEITKVGEEITVYYVEQLEKIVEEMEEGF